MTYGTVPRGCPSVPTPGRWTPATDGSPDRFRRHPATAPIPPTGAAPGLSHAARICLAAVRTLSDDLSLRVRLWASPAVSRGGGAVSMKMAP
jgi:hypothetical protein